MAASISLSARHWLGCTEAFHAPHMQPDSLIGDPLIAQEMEMQIRPLYDRVIVKRIETQRTTASGIVIPDSAAENQNRAKSSPSAAAGCCRMERCARSS